MFTNKQITAGIIQSSAWGTAIQVQDEDYFLVLKENIDKERTVNNDLSLSEDFIHCNDLSNIKCDGELESYLQFNSPVMDLLFFLCTGISSENPVGIVMRRTLTPDVNIFGKFCTIAIDKILAVHELTSSKISGFNIEAGINQLLKVKFMVMADDKIIDSTVNTLSVLNDVSAYQIANADDLIPIPLKIGTFLIDDYGNSLESGDEIGISQFSFTFSRDLASDYVANASEGNKILEPCTDGAHQIFCEVTLPYYNTLDFINNFDLETLKVASIEFVGPDIPTTAYRYTFKINMNRMKIVNQMDIINEVGLQPLILRFQLLDDNALGPFSIFIQNENLDSY